MTENNPPRPLRAAGRAPVDGVWSLCQVAVRAVASLKAEGIVVLDVTGRTSYCDALVICTGVSGRQVRAIAERVVRSNKDAGLGRPLGVEGLDAARWCLVDLGDVIVHVFEARSREQYDLDGLWQDARQVSMEDLGLDAHGLLPGEARPNVDRSLLEPDDEDLSDELDPDLEGLEYIDEDGDLDQDDDLGEDEDLDEDEALDEDELDEDELDEDEDLDEDELDEDAATDEQAR